MHREIILCIHYDNICSKALLKHNKKRKKKHKKFLNVADKGVTNTGERVHKIKTNILKIRLPCICVFLVSKCIY